MNSENIDWSTAYGTSSPSSKDRIGVIIIGGEGFRMNVAAMV
jgi:hypothetical protein